MHKIFITGGCGFIGSHLTEYFFKKYKKSLIYVYDKITYAASVKNLRNISKSKRLKIIKRDLSDYKALEKYSKNTDLFIHAAAESHVDNSFNLTNEFITTNVLGTKNVLDACKINKIKKIIHISTDEIYGEIYKSSFNENSRFNPSNPYSSSKAAAEMIINCYIHSYKMPVIIIRANNIFGTRQHPEKLLPGSCWSCIKKKKFTIHGKGDQKRSFLFVEDLCEGIYKVVLKGKNNNIYNIGSKYNLSTIQIIKKIYKIMKIKENFEIKNFSKLEINNQRLNYNKIRKELNWKPIHSLENSLKKTIEWYTINFKKFK